MVYSPRIGPDGAFIREFSELRDRVKSIETAPAGTIVIREKLITEDPATGVKTIIGQLPDGSIGIQPFVGDITPPPVATTPVVSVQPGYATVAWDGLFVNNEEKPRDFEHVNVIGHKIVDGDTVLSVEVGVIRLPNESVIVTTDVAAVGETWEFSLASEDFNGNTAARSTRSAPVVMQSVVTDEGVNAALEQINLEVVTAQSAAASAQDAADRAQDAADEAAQAVVDLGSIKGAIYTQSVTPSADPNGLWIDTGPNNIPRRYLGKTGRALVANLGGGASIQGRLSSLGWAVSAVTTTPSLADASTYDVVAFDAGYAGLSSGISTLAESLLARGVSIYTSGNDTTSLPYLFTGYATRGTPKNPIRPVGTHAASQGWSQYSDNDANFYLTGLKTGAIVTGVTLVGSTDQPMNLVYEHPSSFARWVHVETYATPAAVIDAHLNWLSDSWVAVQDQGIISASSAAASAQLTANQAASSATAAATAAGQAQNTANNKNTTWYTDTMPTGTGHKVGDIWFDKANNNRVMTWDGDSWETTQDAWLAKEIADSKSLVYTQATVPPVEARLATTVWYDTSLGLDKIVQKYWNGTTWVALTDKAATDAKAVADSKGETIYSSTEPAADKRLPQNTWVDTTGGLNISKRWDGYAWQVVADARIETTAAAVTAAQETADAALDSAEAKSVVYTQATMPPTEARLPQTIWNDTSLGLDKIVVKYWNGSTWAALADKAATDARTVADSKGETIYSSTEPSADKRLPQNTWVDTSTSLNLNKRWNGSAWVTVEDSRIASTAVAVTAAQDTANTALDTAETKSIVYTQATTPPVEARLPQTLWNDTSLGLDKIVVKYWNGSAWTPLADKVATEAAAVAAAKTKTYFQTNQPAVTGNTAGDLWFDTDDGNKPYVWNGSAWTVAQDATVNKSLFSSFATDIDSNQPNKWMFTRYNKTMPSNTTIPTYLDIAGIAGTSSLVADGANLVNTVGDAYVGQLRTIVNVVSTKTIALTATHDDAAQIYVDGVSVYSKNIYTQNAAISFSLTAGWHVIDLLWTEISGGDGWFNISPTFGSQVTSMFAPVALSSLSQAVSAAQSSANAAQTSADTAMSAQSYSTNASFDNWTGTFPVGFGTFGALNPVKETSIVRRAPFAARFNIPDTTTQGGMTFTAPLSHAPNLEYFVVEVEFYLVSGGLGGAGVILDWNGMTNNRTQINFASEIASPVTGKWYRITKTLRRPTNATGTWTGMGGYLMGQWSGHGTGAAKNIIFDWFNVRPATTEEILAYNAPADAQSKADTAKTQAIAAAALDATNKAETAEADAILAASLDAQQKAATAKSEAIQAASIDATNKAVSAQNVAIAAADAKVAEVWKSSRGYFNDATTVDGLVSHGPAPTVVDSATAVGGKAWKSNGANGYFVDTRGKMAFDPSSLYRIRARVREVSATDGKFYLGFAGYGADGTTYVNSSGSNAITGQHWLVNGIQIDDSGAWVDVEGYARGYAVGNSGPYNGGILNPTKLHSGVKYIAPELITDFGGTSAGIVEVSHISVDVVDSTGAEAIEAAEQAKVDAIAAAALDATQKANAAQQAAIDAAALDAEQKATAAEEAAIAAAALDATYKAEQAEADALAAAAITAQQKADAAKQEAIDAAAIEAQLIADGAEQSAIDAAAITAQQKADAAEEAAIAAAAADATSKANQAEADAIEAAALDAQTRATEAKTQAIEAAATDATTKADAAQRAAIQAQGYQLNPSFEDWTGTVPANYTTFVNYPTKETTTVLTGKNAARFNCTDATTQRGLQFNAALAHAPYFEYLTVELDVRLDSGTSFGGSGVLVDWGGMAGGNRVTISLASEIPAPVTGRWYRMVKVIRKPATATGTFTNYSAWLMGQYSSGMGTMAIKNVIFDWINVRPATTEEITSFGTTGQFTTINSNVSAVSATAATKTKSWFQPGQPPLTGNTTGDLWFDTDDNNKVYIWNGTWAVASDQRIESLNTSVSAAQASANGKNKVIHSTSPASGTSGFVAGDTWFQRDGSNNIIAMWEFTTSWQSRALSHQVHASIDAAKISVGTLDVANRIAANAITTSKLTVSDMEDFIPNPFFHPSGEPVLQGTIVTTANTPVSAGAPYPNAVLFTSRDNHPFSYPNIPVKPGDQFYLEVWVASAATAIRNFNLYMFGSNSPTGGLTAKTSTGNMVPGTTWRKVTWNYTVPSTNPGFTYIRPVLQINNSGGETAAQMEWYATGLSMKRKNTGELIVDGAIKANSAIIENGAIGNAHIGELAVGTAEIQNGAIKTAQIDDLAVTDGKISSLNAGKITAGYLDARVIAAGSIKADKLDVTLGGANLVENSSFEVDTDNNGLADGWQTWARGAGDAGRVFTNTRPAGLFPGSTYAQRVTSTTVTNTEASSIQATTLFSISEGVSATISLYGRASVAGNYSISIRCQDDTGAYKGDANFTAAFTTETQRFMGTVVIFAGTTKGKITITTPTSLSNGHWFEVDGVKAELGNIGSAWSPRTEELLPGTITGELLSATAIDGKVITGATVQTTSTAARGIKLTSSELAGYDNAGVKNFSLTSAGALTLRGDMTSGSTITGATVTGSTVQTEATANRGIKLTTGELAGYDTSGNKNFQLTTGGTLTIKGDITAGSTITGATITGATIQTEATVSRGIKMTTGEFAGYDTAGVKNFSLTSAGVLSLKGSIESGSTIKGATLAAGTGGIETNTAVNRGVKLKDAGILAYDASGNLTFKVDAATGVLEVPGLKANSIKGDMIDAKAITADKMVLGSSVNLFDDAPWVSKDISDWETINQGVVTNPVFTEDTLSFSRGSTVPMRLISNGFRPVTAGEKFLVHIPVITAPVSGTFQFWTYTLADNGSTTGVQMTTAGAAPVEWTVPAGVVGIKPYVYLNSDVPSANVIKIGRPQVIRKIVGSLIVDGAIDGKVITGATIQTETTAARGIKLNSSGLTGYDTTGQANFSLTSAGVLSVRGSIESGSKIKGVTLEGAGIETTATPLRGVKMTSTGVSAWDGSGNLSFRLNGNTGLLEVPGLAANSIKGSMVEANAITVEKLSVTDFSNYAENPSFETGDLRGWDVVGGWTVNTAAPYDGTYKALAQYNGTKQSITNKMEFNLPVGGKVRVKLRLYAEGVASGAMLGLALVNKNGTLESDITHTQTGNWVEVDKELTATTAGPKRLQIYTTGSHATSGWIRVDAIVVNRMVNGELIVDGSIDGKVITGATIQTDNTPVSGSSARGIKLTPTELAGYNTSGVKVFTLATDGTLSLRGALTTGSTISGTQVTGSEGIQTSTVANTGVKINNTGIKAYDAGNNLTFHLDATTGLLELPGLKANSITGDKIASKTIQAKNLLISDFANLATIDETNNITVNSYGQTMVSAGYNKLVNDTGSFLMFTDQRGPIPFAKDDTLYYEFTAKATATTTTQFGVWTYGSANASVMSSSFTINTTDTPVSGSLKVTNYATNATQFVIGLNGVANKGIQVKNVRVYRKSGSTLITDGAITTDHMTVGTIDGKVITTNTLKGSAIISKSIEVDRLVVSSTDNLIVEAAFEHPTTPGSSWERNANKVIQTGGGRNGGNALRFIGLTTANASYNLNNKVVVDDDNRFRVSMWVKTNVAFANGTIRLGVRPYKGTAAQSAVTLFSNSTDVTSDNYVPGTNTWTQISGFTSVLPTGTTALEFYVSATAPSTTAYLDVDSVAVTRAADGNLVVDGAIDGKTITGALFQTDNSPLDSSASRGIKLNGAGLKAYDPFGNKTFGIDALTGEVSSSGTFSTADSQYSETNGTWTIGAVFGNLTYDSHTEYSGIPGIKFTRVHSSEGPQSPATIMYDGRSINMSTYDPDVSTFAPNTNGASVAVGEGVIGLYASHNASTMELTDEIPSPKMEFDGGTWDNPGYEHIYLSMDHRLNGSATQTGLFIERGENDYDTLYDGTTGTIHAGLRSRSNQYQGTDLGGSDIAVGNYGMWVAKGRAASDGSMLTKVGPLNLENTGRLSLFGVDGVTIGTLNSSNDQLTITDSLMQINHTVALSGSLTVTGIEGQSTGEIDAKAYKINGVPMSSGEVQVWDASGTMSSATIPVPRIQGFSHNGIDSTSSALSINGTGFIMIQEEGVYDVHWSYGQSGGTNQDRNFLEIKTDGMNIPMARASFANGEDSATASATGVKLAVGQKLYFEVYQNGSARTFNSKIRIKRTAAPVPTVGYQTGDINHTGNFTISGEMKSKPQFASAYNNGFTVAGNNTPWDSGSVTLDTAKSRNNDFVQVGPYSGSIAFSRSGWYQVSLLLVASSSPGASWARIFLGSTGENLCQAANSNGQIWEIYLSTVPIYIAAGDYVRSTVIAATQHNVTSRWKITRMPWDN